jgi:hypothetical protein
LNYLIANEITKGRSHFIAAMEFNLRNLEVPDCFKNLIRDSYHGASTEI